MASLQFQAMMEKSWERIYAPMPEHKLAEMDAELTNILISVPKRKKTMKTQGRRGGWGFLNFKGGG